MEELFAVLGNEILFLVLDLRPNYFLTGRFPKFFDHSLGDEETFVLHGWFIWLVVH